MKISIPAGEAALHAASTLTGQFILTREGALLSFQVDDLNLDDTIGALEAALEEVDTATLNTTNPAEIAGYADLRRAASSFEREIRLHFRMRDAAAGQLHEAATTSVGSQPTGTGDDATSNVSTQLSDQTQSEEHEHEEPEEGADRPRRRAGR